MGDLTSFTDWLGNEVYLGDLVVYPQRQGSAGAELILGRVLGIEQWDGQGEKPSWVSWYDDFGRRVRLQPVRRSRYGHVNDKSRPVWITITVNLTKVTSSGV
jgi:hypothetical protein